MDINIDWVLYNGKIHTQNNHQPLVEALVVRDGKIIFSGSSSEALKYVPSAASEKALDLKGACVIPGLTDSHLHFQYYSIMLQNINAELPDIQDVLHAVAEAAARKPKGSWITGFGWNRNVWGGVMPTAALLDAVAPDHPVCLNDKSGHAVWVNSAAMRIAGIHTGTVTPQGGEIVRDAAGNPTGLLLEEANLLVESIIPQPGVDELAEMVKQAMAVANRSGLTSIHDFDTPLLFRAFQKLHRERALKLRVTKGIPLAYLDKALDLGLTTGFGDDWLRIGALKLFADGALGPRTAWMLQGFSSAPDQTGIATTDINIIREAVFKANAAGLACAIHAIGDRATREVLNVFAEAKTKGLTGNLRNRIEHVQLLSPEDRYRLAELNIIASMQPIHATSDMYIADQHWGEERCAGAYALKTQIEAGAVLALGSDCPVETFDPLQGIHAAVTRRRADGTPGPSGWRPEQRISVAEALKGYTLNPAYATGMEDRLGILAPGWLADLVVLDGDLFEVDPMDMLKLKVLGTMVGGDFAWRAESLS
ncbi:MAG: amidohydrolase family protein [Anaerolineae bacterium]|nr:amidohydrolase family protein [Anaerolineae bacterium]